jgi:hypothetical protein
LIEDSSGALSVEVHDSTGGLVRRMSPITKQIMMNEGRPDPRVTTGTLASGESWRWEGNLAEWHYPLPQGEHRLTFRYDFDREGVHIESAPVSVVVEDASILEIRRTRDRPILDGLTEVVRCETDSGGKTYLRLYSWDRPLACWFTEPVEIGDTAGVAFAAQANFFQPESFMPFFRRWLVWQEGGQVKAGRYFRGKPEGKTRSASLPDTGALYPFAVSTEGDDLLVFTRSQDGLMTCYELADSAISRRFEHRSRITASPHLAMGADAECLYLVAPLRGLEAERVDLNTGTVTAERRLYSTRMMSWQCRVDTNDRTVSALYTDGCHTVESVKAPLDGGGVSIQRYDLPLRGDIRELGFDVDRKGVHHLLVTTSRKRLYYFSGSSGPWCICRGEEQYNLCVHADKKVFLGCHRLGLGYRYLQVGRKPDQPTVIDFETEMPPPEDIRPGDY